MHQSNAQVLFGMWHTNMSTLTEVRENMMTTFHPAQAPAISFQLFDKLFAVHGGYYNHLQGKVNAFIIVTRL